MLAKACTGEGPGFRRIDRRALTPQLVHLILKCRCKQACPRPHVVLGSRNEIGYITEAARPGIPLPEAIRPIASNCRHYVSRRESLRIRLSLRKPTASNTVSWRWLARTYIS